MVGKQLSDEMKDRIKGLIYGQALGDSIGLCTEFMGKKDILANYGTKGFKFTHNNCIRDSHRVRWKKGEWTDDTDQFLLIIDSLLTTNGLKPDILDFSKRLLYWSKYPIAGMRGCGIGMNTMNVLSHPSFTSNPIKSSSEIHNKSTNKPRELWSAANGSLMRTGAVALFSPIHNIDDIGNIAVQLSLVTHYDTQCSASVYSFTTACALCINGYRDKNSIIRSSYIKGLKYLDHEPESIRQRFTKYCFSRNFDDLDLADNPAIGIVLKCLGSAFVAFKYKDFKTAINELTYSGGDADTNCAVAGALLGSYLGYKALPSDWINSLANKSHLDSRYLAIIDVLQR